LFNLLPIAVDAAGTRDRENFIQFVTITTSRSDSACMTSQQPCRYRHCL